MKKRFLLPVLLTSLLGIQLQAEPAPGQDPEKVFHVSSFSRLIIDAAVTVILYEAPENNKIILKGEERLIRQIGIIQQDDRITITSNWNDDMKNKIQIFVPVSRLRVINVESNANLRSAEVLQIPELKIRLNGYCDVALVVKGKVNVEGSPNYDFRPYKSNKEKVLSLAASPLK